MIYIDLTGKEPPKDWQEKANLLKEELLAAATIQEKNKIIDKNHTLWGELKDHLSAVTNRKCWYSESRDDYSHCHVDHFRPKKVAYDIDGITNRGGYWWLAFDWKNYRFSGPAGNVRKKDYFAVKKYRATKPEDPVEDEIIYFLDPLEIDDPLKLTFTEEGIVKPIATIKTDWDYLRAEYTIKYLNLNFESLKEARKSIWKKCSDAISEVQELMEMEQANQSAARKQKIKDKLSELTTMVHPKSEFSATAKTCLISSGLSWAIRIAA